MNKSTIDQLRDLIKGKQAELRNMIPISIYDADGSINEDNYVQKLTQSTKKDRLRNEISNMEATLDELIPATI